MKQIPLGRPTSYPETYAPEVLVPIARAAAREPLGLRVPLPFTGTDIWNAWELTWLEPGGKPAVATAEIRVPAESPNIVESKSLKLYLGSFAMSEYGSMEMLRDIIATDLGAAAGCAVEVALAAGETPATRIARLPGRSIDALEIGAVSAEVDASLLRSDPDDTVGAASLHTHLLRSLCPVTGQPDTAHLLIRYIPGARCVETKSLKFYLASFRNTPAFNEEIVNRILKTIEVKTVV